MSPSTSVTSDCHHYYTGSEFDFVIFSTVRSMPHQTIKNKAAVQADRAWIRENLGFITDCHQICVGITRAKHGLVIVGKCVVCMTLVYMLLYRHISVILMSQIGYF